MDPKVVLILVFVILLLTVVLAVLTIFASLFQLWLQAFLSGARVSLIQIVGMRLRRSPAKDIIRWTCMSTQCGVPVSAAHIESAHIQGVNVERAILTLKKAREEGIDVKWDEIVQADFEERTTGVFEIPGIHRS
ncbi:flotillin-like FloA family protein [Rubinisphaera margarita]|uniref:flotillin-like FloA family protein n=1 Tax=Rubinisphaera margarita TaxID=2909586 RepID=UPI001EE7BBB1|nr:flotillin-like FloA family protein [Rubinisphaera margarita]MCG6158526.1 flotillin-like FloA family protein [Rubinisphaera margarita]